MNSSDHLSSGLPRDRTTDGPDETMKLAGYRRDDLLLVLALGHQTLISVMQSVHRLRRDLDDLRSKAFLPGLQMLARDSA